MNQNDADSILAIYENELKDAPCSAGHHLNIRGGLLIHLHNTENAAKEIDPTNEELHALAKVHDIGKGRTYTIAADGKIAYAVPGVDHLINTIAMITESGYRLTQEELHALQFHHGGWSPFARNASLTELAVKLHTADMLATTREITIKQV
jgi:23S rRNA maturation-related 3'-5' exoribonuclease YhaM